MLVLRRWMRVPTAAGMLQPYSDGLMRDRCATAAAETLLPVIALPAAYFAAARGSWLAVLDARGAFRGRQVQVLFTGTTGVLLTKERLWAKHRDGRGGEESSGRGRIG